MADGQKTMREALEKAFRMGAAFSRSDVELGHMIQADFAAHVIDQCAALDAGSKDAERYRWLRDYAVWSEQPDPERQVWCVIGRDAQSCYPADPQDIDELVDAGLALHNAI